MDSVKQFDYSIIPEYPAILNIAKRRLGKSFLTRDLVFNYFYKIKKYKFFIVISPTCRLNKDYDFIPDDCKFERFSDTLLLKIFERQDNLKKKYGDKGDFNLLLILDDCVGTTNRTQSKLLAQIWNTGRHRKLAIITNLQYLFTQECSKSARDSNDLIFVFQQNNTENIKAIVSQWIGGSKEKEKIGYNIIEKVPDGEKHRILVIDNTKIRDNLYHYTAETIPDKAKIKKY